MTAEDPIATPGTRAAATSASPPPAGRPDGASTAQAARGPHAATAATPAGEARSATPHAATPAMEAIGHSGVAHRVIRTERASSAEESARFQGIATRQLLRTIVVRRGEGDYLFVLVPAGRRFDWPKLRELLGVRRMTLPDADEARAVTGYERYTITAFGSTTAWPVIADAAIVAEPVVSIGGGGIGINIHLAPADLVAALDARVADVSVAEAPRDHDRGQG